MTIEWTEDIASGINEIDNPQKELLKKINGLIEAGNKGKGKEEVSKAIKFLEDYAVTQFSMEEKLMAKYTYPNYFTHIAQHMQFIKDFSEIKRKFETDGAGVHIAILTNHLLGNWFTNHICKSDKALGVFLKTKMR